MHSTSCNFEVILLKFTGLLWKELFISSAKEVMFSSVFVSLSICLAVYNITQKVMDGLSRNFQDSSEMGQGLGLCLISFWGDLDQCLDVFSVMKVWFLFLYYRGT